MNHIRFPKEDQLADWARRDNKVTKGAYTFVPYLRISRRILPGHPSISSYYDDNW
jgi:hypothetical protein